MFQLSRYYFTNGRYANDKSGERLPSEYTRVIAIKLIKYNGYHFTDSTDYW